MFIPWLIIVLGGLFAMMANIVLTSQVLSRTDRSHKFAVVQAETYRMMQIAAIEVGLLLCLVVWLCVAALRRRNRLALHP
jgi:uncharacterized membrane protein YhaH (DUF805 family)